MTEFSVNRVPYVIEKDGQQEKNHDLFSRLLKDRIIFINGPVTSELADSVVAQLLFLESQDQTSDINIYINTRGGEIDAMYAMFDTMNYIKPDIATIGYGCCMSAGSFLLAAGTRGKRHALVNTNIMIHELSGGAGGKFHDVRSTYAHVNSLYEKMAKDFSDLTGQSVKKIKEDMRVDNYLTAEEAKSYGKYGIIDFVQTKRV